MRPETKKQFDAPLPNQRITEAIREKREWIEKGASIYYDEPDKQKEYENMLAGFEICADMLSNLLTITTKNEANDKPEWFRKSIVEEMTRKELEDRLVKQNEIIYDITDDEIQDEANFIFGNDSNSFAIKAGFVRGAKYIRDRLTNYFRISL